MKHKISLVLIEQACMILVFALAAALCQGGFAWADARAEEIRLTDWAYTQVESEAERLEYTHGSQVTKGETLYIFYEEEDCTLRIESVETDQPLLGASRLTMEDADGRILAQIEVFYQKGDSHA